MDDLEYDELGINWTQEFASYPSIEDSMYDSTYSSAASTSSGMSWKKFGVPRFFFHRNLQLEPVHCTVCIKFLASYWSVECGTSEGF